MIKVTNEVMVEEIDRHVRNRMLLEHYTNEPLVEILTRSQIPRASNNKPRGLWVSVKGKDDWPSWCESEDFEIGKICYRVKLKDNANILHLRSPGALDVFTGKFGEEIQDFHYYVNINWENVAKKYDGIIISPYQWTRRLEYRWYYGWDCASGCIWSKDAIDKIEIEKK